eukprot:365188-Chlamydomonas_euryale.AAC.11
MVGCLRRACACHAHAKQCLVHVCTFLQALCLNHTASATRPSASSYTPIALQMAAGRRHAMRATSCRAPRSCRGFVSLHLEQSHWHIPHPQPAGRSR